MADGVLDECIHGMTIGFCSMCKANVPAARNARQWEMAMADPFSDETSFDWKPILPPHTLAKFDGVCGNPDCGEEIEDRELIGLRDGVWFCNDCAYDYDIAATRLRHPSGMTTERTSS